MKKIFALLILASLCFYSCSDDDAPGETNVNATFNFSHNWDGTPVTSSDFNTFQYTNENGETISIERLRYLISDVTFTNSDNEVIELDVYNLINLTNDTNLSFDLGSQIPTGDYRNVSFTFGFDNEDNSENYIDLNSASF
ncbi:MAG: hypothetical protein EVB12_01935, partial [Winogradskyella sp.]